MKYPVPVCYHPTTVLFIDDDRNYLTNLSLGLKVDKFSFKLLVNPKEALDFLANYESKPFTRYCITRPEEEFFDHRNIGINVRKIRTELYNPHRFDEISVLVVDYAMPGLNGIDFAKECRLKNYPFKILMLTGQADENQAIEAFNVKIIDKFIRKSASNFKEILNAAIIELQKQYFLDLSQIIIDSLVKDPDNPIVTWLDEPGFLQLFQQLCAKHDVTEYYLTDAFGSYMFIDFYGNPSWLVVKAKEDMEAAYQVAADAENLPEDLIQTMRNYEKVLYLHERGGLSDKLEDLQKSLHPALKLEGNRGIYYYSYIVDPKAYYIVNEHILFYAAYRDKLFEKSS